METLTEAKRYRIIPTPGVIRAFQYVGLKTDLVYCGETLVAGGAVGIINSSLMMGGFLVVDWDTDYNRENGIHFSTHHGSSLWSVSRDDVIFLEEIPE